MRPAGKAFRETEHVAPRLLQRIVDMRPLPNFIPLISVRWQSALVERGERIRQRSESESNGGIESGVKAQNKKTVSTLIFPCQQPVSERYVGVLTIHKLLALFGDATSKHNDGPVALGALEPDMLPHLYTDDSLLDALSFFTSPSCRSACAVVVDHTDRVTERGFLCLDDVVRVLIGDINAATPVIEDADTPPRLSRLLTSRRAAHSTRTPRKTVRVMRREATDEHLPLLASINH